MNPDKVTRSDGSEVGYSCDVCSRFFQISTFDQYTDSKDESVYTAKMGATDCCLCAECKRQTQQAAAQFCDFCNWKLRFSHFWSNLGVAIKLGITNEIVWEIVLDQLDYGDYMHRLETFLKRFPAYIDAKAKCDACSSPLLHARYNIVGDRWLCDLCC